MPEATLLYTVAAVVLLGLVVWVAVVLAFAKEPWARPLPPMPMPVEGGAPALAGGGALVVTPPAEGAASQTVSSEPKPEPEPATGGTSGEA